LLSDNFLKYEFVKRDKFGEIAHHLDPSFGSAFESEFYLKVSDMSREIAKFITNYVETDTEAAPGQAPSAAQPKVLPEETEEQDDAQEAQPLIYLAEPSPDLWDQYNEIKRDLEQREIKFLPANLNPLTRKLRFREDYKKQVLEDVKKCRLAVHLIGKENNFYPAEGKPSYLHLQTGVVNEYAGDPESNPDFKRLIWFPKDAQSDDEEHHTFIEEIRAKASGKIEFLQNSLEDFKSNIQDGLKPPPAPPPEPPPEDPPWVYVVYHKGDLDMAYDVEDYLQNQGYAIFPARDYLALDTDGSAEKLEINKKIADDTHKDYLLKCDGVLIYWNSAPTSWVRNSIFELQGIKPDRNRNFRANAVFCDGDIEAADKVRFRPPLPNLFKVIYPPLNNTLKQKVVYPPLNSAFKKNGYSEFPDFLSRLEVQN
jgi:hypothetical protein